MNSFVVLKSFNRNDVSLYGYLFALQDLDVFAEYRNIHLEAKHLVVFFLIGNFGKCLPQIGGILGINLDGAG